MADNTTLPGTGEIIASDELTTLNGGAVSGVKVQRVKVGFGSDAVLRDVDAANPLPVYSPEAAATGSLAALNATLVLALGGNNGASVQIGGTWVGTITFEGTLDSVTWFPINGVSASTSAPQTTTTVNGLYRLTPGGLVSFRANMTAFTSGSASLSMRASPGTGGTFVNQIVPTKLTDGTSTQSIKPASTAAVAGDAAAVVALHPSSPLPAGSNIVGKVGIDQSTPGTTNAVSVTNTSFAVTNAGTFAVQGTLTAETTKVIGTVNLSAGQTLATVTTVGAVTAITNALPTGANVIGALTANQSINKAQINGVAPLMGNGVTGTGSQRVTIASDNTAFSVNSTLTAETTKVIGTVNVAASQTIAVTQATAANLNLTATPIAITKGTQGATGFTTQDLKDAGRNAVHYYTLIPVLSTATDTLQSLTGTKGGATVTATTTPAVVTTGKTLRITRMAATYIATATSGYGVVRLRGQSAGVATITSPVYATLAVGSGTPATANATGAEEATLDEAIEFVGGFGIGISVQGFAAATATAVGYVFASVTGYEY